MIVENLVKIQRHGALFFIVILLSACQSGNEAVLTPTDTATRPAILATAVPTAGPLFATRTATSTPTNTLPPTETPTPTPTATNTPVPTATPTPARVDHYMLNRPIARQGVDYVDRTYPYASTQYGAREVHLGVEFVNPRGTPVLAAAGGRIVYAGSDAQTVFGPNANYYGNLIVIEHGFTTPEGLPLYTLYAHLDRVDVQEGQMIEQGHQMGIVGDTGIAIGPHLHFEVRAGDPYDFGATRNPDLWIYPYPRFGTLAGLLTDSTGDPVPEVVIQVRTPATETIRYTFSYAEGRINSDPAWGENFTLGDLPEGDYEVVVSNRDGRVRFREMVTILPNRTTWLEIRLN